MISNMTFRLNQYSQALSIFLGCIILTLLFYVSITDNEPFYIFNWATSVLGTTFILMISFLILISILCIINVMDI
jgi:hypothetical protein